MKAFQSNKVQITGPAKAGGQGDTVPLPTRSPVFK